MDHTQDVPQIHCLSLRTVKVQGDTLYHHYVLMGGVKTCKLHFFESKTRVLRKQQKPQMCQYPPPSPTIF